MQGKGVSFLAAAAAIFVLAVLVTSVSASAQTIYAFNPNPGGTNPYSALISDAAGNFYGTTVDGGAYGVGTVFELSPRQGGGWTQKVLYSFKIDGIDGDVPHPFGSLVFDAQGNLYGTTTDGYEGMVFELSPGPGGSWTETILSYIPPSYSGLILDANGNLYGTSYSVGGEPGGLVFELSHVDGTWTFTVLHSFDCSFDGRGINGCTPVAGVILDSAGNLYGTTTQGGAYGDGTVFELSPGPGGSWTETVLHSFGFGADGSNPRAGLILDAHGNLYSTTFGGGAYHAGTAFELSPAQGGGWTEAVLHSFGHGADGSSPYAALILDSAGNLYGTTYKGGTAGAGTVFELSPDDGNWTETVLYSFDPYGVDDGGFPHAGLTSDAHGNLYGTTYACGIYYRGTAFELSPSAGGGWSETMLFNFSLSGTDGIDPVGDLVSDAHGNLYGTTYTGGTHGYGTVFELSPGPGGSWTETLLYSFCPQSHCPDGANPQAGLILDANGNLYGTAAEGGAHGYGAVFELSPGTGGSWTETVLHSFKPNGTDGAYPYAGLIFDASGNLYSTTYAGGTYGDGTVFELSPGHGGSWTETVLHSFSNNGSDGANPAGGLVFDAHGNLYGTTYSGGANTQGSVFELSPAGGGWTETVLYSFPGDSTDGYNPDAGLIVDAAGNLYGTTLYGGGSPFSNGGTAFELSPGHDGWTETVLHVFSIVNSDGLNPEAGLVFDAHGNLYGTTYYGGDFNLGAVFELSPVQGGNWTEQVLDVFDVTNGNNPRAGLFIDANGNLFGTTSGGGTYTYGTVFKLSP